MANTLILKSSIMGELSQSNLLIDFALANRAENTVLVRDLAEQPLPVMDANVASALRSVKSELPEELKSLLQLSNELIAELKEVDTLIIGAPMYNFMIPTQLKNWFDLITRAGVTFQYTETGPQGMLEDKKVVIVTTRGGIHKDTERNAIESYLTTILGFIGISSVEFVYAEALNMGEETARQNRAAALEQLKLVI